LAINEKEMKMKQLNYVASGTYFGCLKEDAEKVAQSVKREMDYYFNNCCFWFNDKWYKSYEHCLKNVKWTINDSQWKGFYNEHSDLVDQFQPLVDKFPVFSLSPKEAVGSSPWLKKAHEVMGKFFGDWEYKVNVVERSSGWTVEIVGSVQDEQ